ncbi:unnamed protein product [Acanthoscelides obtectus]|uniref:Macro domain-containing protein n=1 Tax=Acanthoscelides obtectus TaxID=200917 RepID=A0A9P0LED4_ACAOB|nr:unnamed protein product [Acanthoscelides obtectus]CAK1681988.1 O-acetyl-ADP-ribose deacetylase 1 [Acanthoscelides obtectus]
MFIIQYIIICRNRRYRPQKYSDAEWKMWWAQYNTGVTHYCDYEEVRADLFTAPLDYSLGHCVSQDLKMSRCIAKIFRQKYGGLEELRAQHVAPGGVGVLKREGRLLFYMVTKKHFWGKPTYITIFLALRRVREYANLYGVNKVAFPRIACGLDRKNWGVISKIIKFVFQDTEIAIKIYVM